MAKITIHRAVRVKGKALGLENPYSITLPPGEHDVDDKVADFIKENCANSTLKGEKAKGKSRSKSKAKADEE